MIWQPVIQKLVVSFLGKNSGTILNNAPIAAASPIVTHGEKILSHLRRM
jgi:hypothetical protein